MTQNWKDLKCLLGSDMEPSDFLEAHPEISRAQLASLLGVAEHTINRWFMTGDAHREPSEPCKRLMSVIHWYLTQQQAIPSLFTDIDALNDFPEN